MRQIFLDHFFYKSILVSQKHPEFVFQSDACDDIVRVDETGRLQFETIYALANLFGIRIRSGHKLVQPYMIKELNKRIRIPVPEPFYKGFPASVRKLSSDQLLFDQLVHYAITYGFGDFSNPGHSLFEEQFERTAFQENTTTIDMDVISEDEAILQLKEMVGNLLSGTRPLSSPNFELICAFLEDYDFVPEQIASKNTLVNLLLKTRSASLLDHMMLSDVIRLVDELNYYQYGNKNIKKLNLKNQDRKWITSIIDRLIATGKCDIRTCCEKKQRWNGLLHHIHYHASTPEGQQFVNIIRGKENLSVYSAFEKAMSEKNISAALEALKTGKGSGAVLRNLNYIISRSETMEDFQQILDSMETKNVIVLIQLLLQYASYQGSAMPRTFLFTKYNLLKSHTETPEEQAKRRSALSEGQVKMLAAKIRENLQKILAGRLGCVYIDPAMKNYALPISESTAQSGYGVLPKGSKIKLPEAKKLRAFTYWEKVDDIDLSVFGIDERGAREEFSWRTMAGKQSDAITYSGDETSGFNGGSEFFDIDMEKFRAKYPGIRYLVFCDNVFTRKNFDQCFCKAGYMTRDLEDSGQIYEPKTVKSSFMINADSTYAYLFGIDLNTNELVWLNLALEDKVHVAGDREMDFLLRYFHVTEAINMYSFFEMMATSLTDDLSKADVIVTDKAIETATDAEVIREYDFEKMIALLNQKP
ncbi:MAG: hypothetical protein IK078_10140 [Lachnospiraceae bacterium]|nr:hypothetical protein [Lachnospiraceae bacterium]